ncbi:E3 ubiquitin-protein ligase TRIM58 isoform X1 [Heterocephalus glaber]|uniref:E3 ubiquitin-protein ligase TRIM58 isoform X1 n=1 Tax=Heterocephalus glaber TaxID=10181 RepID=A0AAX6QIV9_HETGA|nr:E3 ubiquitin-protein ligase TRIM58 isoform X1 [Heterocephalus glaber]
MASGPGAQLQEDARCAVCLDLLRAPVTVDCGHSFCAACVRALLDAQPRSPARAPRCPQCRADVRPEGVRPNRQLAALVDGVRRLALAEGAAGDAEGARCALHGQEVALFCPQDGRVLCRVCAAGDEHQGHHPTGLREAMEEHRVKLQQALETVQKEMEEASAQEVNVGKKTVVWKEKVEVQRQRFRLEFEKYRGFLALEERLQQRWLEEEERATLQRLRDSRARLAQQSKALKELVEELEQRSQRPALGLLEGVSEVLTRSTAVTRLECETTPLELRTVCCIPGMRDMMRRFQVDMKLDPSTAHPSLLLTADLRSVREGELWRDVPGDPKRSACPSNLLDLLLEDRCQVQGCELLPGALFLVRLCGCRVTPSSPATLLRPSLLPPSGIVIVPHQIRDCGFPPFISSPPHSDLSVSVSVSLCPSVCLPLDPFTLLSVAPTGPQSSSGRSCPTADPFKFPSAHLSALISCGRLFSHELHISLSCIVLFSYSVFNLCFSPRVIGCETLRGGEFVY